MTTRKTYFKSTVTAFCLTVMFSLPVAAEAPDQAKIDELLMSLSQAKDAADATRIEKEIRFEWSKSGSPSMNLLLKRGNDALEVGEVAKAIDHFTALTDHAPNFAEGWHGLALAHYTAEQFGVAMDALERTLQLNPQHFGALRGLAAVLEQVDKPVRAYEVYSEVLKINPNDQEVTEALKRLEVRVKGRSL